MSRPLPYNIEAEEAVIGSLMIDNSSITKIVTFLRANDFYREKHQWLYEALFDLHSRGEPADPVTLTDELERSGRLGDVGGPAAVTELFMRVPTAIHVEYYARIVERNAILRRLVGAAEKIARMAYEDQDQEVSEIIERAERELFSISQNRISGALVSLKEILGDYYEQVEELYLQRHAVGLQTGFTDLDRLLGGFQAGDLIILAARPSVGKTALGLSLIESAALKFGARVALFSLEMGVDQIAQRLVSSQTGIDAQRLRVGPIYEEDLDRVNFAVESLGKTEVFVDESPALSPLEMRTKLRRLISERGLDLVMVDYLQLMTSGKGQDNRVQEISYISRMLKELARELKVPVVALSQLSRGVEQRQDKRPMLSDLRESGCLTGDTLVTMADSGARVPIRELVGQSGFAVWALNEATQKLERAIVSNAFSTGVKPVLRLTTRLGRTVRATGNHKFLTIEGWTRLDGIATRERIAAVIPSVGYNPQTARVSTYDYHHSPSPDKGIHAPENSVSFAVNPGGVELIGSRGWSETELTVEAYDENVLWDEIITIESDGMEEVFDLTVPGLHNFVGNNIVVHNSIEQDADVVMFIYRDEVYNKNTERPNIAEIIVAKHRNGPVGTVELRFTRENAKFANLETYFGPDDNFGPPPAPMDAGLDDIVF